MVGQEECGVVAESARAGLGLDQPFGAQRAQLRRGEEPGAEDADPLRHRDDGRPRRQEAEDLRVDPIQQHVPVEEQQRRTGSVFLIKKKKKKKKKKNNKK